MKRRDFLKFMGVSAASTVASDSLIALPETHPQIELLKTPGIITSLDPATPIMFNRILSYDYKLDNNYQFRKSIYGHGEYAPGREEGTISVHALAETWDGQPILFTEYREKKTFLSNLELASLVEFNIEEVRDKLFRVMEFQVTGDESRRFTTVNITAFEMAKR